MKAYYKDEEKYNRYYRQVEAMYHKGYDNKRILDSVPLPNYEVMEMIQKVFGIEQVKRERRRDQ